jgi:hypothetical protein
LIGGLLLNTNGAILEIYHGIDIINTFVMTLHDLLKTRGSQEPVIAPWIKAAFNSNATALWWPFWWESETAEHNFGRVPSNDYSIKVWF